MNFCGERLERNKDPDTLEIFLYEEKTNAVEF